MIGTPVESRTRWGARVVLSPFASEAEVDRALVEARVLSASTWPDGARFDYPRDHHFECFVLRSISTIEDAEAFLARLDEGARRRGFLTDTCSKARYARGYLSKDFWREDAGRIRSAISHSRRVSCGCHETGSFAEYERARAERYSRRAELQAEAA